MMSGYAYAYQPQSGWMNVVVNGAIPYATFNLYVYSNCEALSNNSYIYQLNTGGVSVGPEVLATQLATATSYVQATGGLQQDGGTPGNYVEFAGLTASEFGGIGAGPTMSISTMGVYDQYGLINGFQIVNAVPEPGTIVLLITGLFGMLAYAWRKRK